MISPYVKQDPTAFCSYEDHILAVDMLKNICLLRAQSIRGQLNGDIPATISGQQNNQNNFIDTSSINIEDLGDFEDLKSAKARQDTALAKILE